MKTIVILPLLLVIAMVSHCFGATSEFDPLQSGLRMMWGLGFVLAIMYILYLITRKYFRAYTNQSEGIINILEIKHILPKKSLILVEIRGKEYLIGTSNDTIGVILPLRSGNTFSDMLDSAEKREEA